MSKYQYSKLVMEKFLRRSFYDAVLELYEAAQDAKIISVSLEGNLSLVVNRNENFVIKLNEVAQRADDRDEQLRYKDMKLEGMDRYVVKKEELFHHHQQPVLETSTEAPLFGNEFGPKDDKISVALNDINKMQMSIEEPKYKLPDDMLREKSLADVSRAESDSPDKSSEAYSESEEEIMPESTMPYHHMPSSSADLSVINNSNNNNNINKLDSMIEVISGDDICFIPVSSVEEYNKRKLEHKEQPEQMDPQGKKSPRKRRKTVDGEEEVPKVEDKSTAANNCDDGGTGGLQLLPHTATGPIIVEEEENYSGSMTEAQVAQLAMLQMREQNMNLFRPQDLEELARQQQQWQMVAYQRSIMEKSYLQMQQYQRDTERLRWEYAAQQAREYPQHTEESEKLYRQAQSQNTATEAALLTAAALEQAKKSTREDSSDLTSSMDKVPSQYLRTLSEEPSTSQLDSEYEEGELRPESHLCNLCNNKFVSMDLLLRHMEKHRTAFERTCSVCQSGTLTGNMLILHMEASHGTGNFSLPSQTTASSTSATTTASVPSTLPEYTQSFPPPHTANYGNVMDDAASLKLPQSPKRVYVKPEDMKQEAPIVHMKMESQQSFDYPIAASSSHSMAASTSDVDGQQDGFLGLQSQFYPLIGCQVCGEKFALSEALDQHVEIHHKDITCSYSCKMCSVNFSTHVDLSQHLSRHEASSANLKCSHCLKSFKSVKQLRLHYVAAHACCHFCEYCRAGFPNAMALQSHEQLHTLDPEKLTFRCDICNKAFYTQSQCSAHKRTHKDEKAHACDVCGSAFFKRGDLTKHVRTVHSPSRLFACKFCGKKGTRMDNMRSHVRSHHKNMTRDQIINMIEVIE